MCVDAIESKDQLVNMCKLLFDLVVHQQQHLHCFGQHSSSLAKFERNFTKYNFYFVTLFMSEHNFYFETEGIRVSGITTTRTNWDNQCGKVGY